MEEEEKLARQKRKWSEFGSNVTEKRVAKDIRNVKDVRDVPSQVDASKFLKITITTSLVVGQEQY